MNPELKAYLDDWQARQKRLFDDHLARTDAHLRSMQDITGCVTGPIQASSGTSELVTASAGLPEPPAPSPSIVASPVVAPAAHIDTIAVVPASCSTECAAQAVMASTTTTLLPWASVSSSSPATSATNVVVSTELTTDDVSEVVQDAHSGINISPIRSMPLAMEEALLSDQVLQPLWSPSPRDMNQCNSSKPQPIPWTSFKDLPAGVHLTEPRPQLQGTLEVAAAMRGFDQEEQFTYLCANLNMLGTFLKKPGTEWEAAIWSDLTSRAPRAFKLWCIPWVSFLFLDLRPPWPPPVQINFSGLCSFAQLDTEDKLPMFPWNPGPAMRSSSAVLYDEWVLPSWDSGQQADASYDQFPCAVRNAYEPGYFVTGGLAFPDLPSSRVPTAIPLSRRLELSTQYDDEHGIVTRKQSRVLVQYTEVPSDPGGLPVPDEDVYRHEDTQAAIYVQKSWDPGGFTMPDFNLHSSKILMSMLTSQGRGNVIVVVVACPAFACPPGSVHLTEQRPPLVSLYWIGRLHNCLQCELYQEENVTNVWRSVDGEAQFNSLGRSLKVQDNFLKKPCVESKEAPLSGLISRDSDVFQLWHIPWFGFILLHLASNQRNGLALFPWGMASQLNGECFDVSTGVQFSILDVKYLLVGGTGLFLLTELWITRFILQYFQWHVAWALPICVPSKVSQSVLAGVLPHECSLVSHYYHGTVIEGVHQHVAEISSVQLMLFKLLLRRPHSELPIGICLYELQVPRTTVAPIHIDSMKHNNSTRSPRALIIAFPEVTAVISLELWYQFGKTITLIWSSRFLVLLNGGEQGSGFHELSLALVAWTDDSLSTEQSRGVQCTQLTWDPGRSTWHWWLSLWDDQTPFQGRRHIPDLDGHEEFRSPWDPGGFSVISAWGQAAFQGGRDVRSLSYIPGWSTGPSHGPGLGCQRRYKYLEGDNDQVIQRITDGTAAETFSPTSALNPSSSCFFHFSTLVLVSRTCTLNF